MHQSQSSLKQDVLLMDGNAEEETVVVTQSSMRLETFLLQWKLLLPRDLKKGLCLLGKLGNSLKCGIELFTATCDVPLEHNKSFSY